MLPDLISKARENMTRREREKVIKAAQKEIRNLGIPLMKSAEKLTLKTIEAAKASASRYDEFEERFPFYNYGYGERDALALTLLSVEANFLATYTHDAGLGLVDWEAPVPLEARKLIMPIRRFIPEADAYYDLAELMEAKNALDAIQGELLKDCTPLVKPLEEFFVDCQQRLGSVRELVGRNQINGIPCNGSYTIPSVGLAEILTAQFLRYPGAVALLAGQKRDVGLWHRAGRDLPPRPAWLDEIKISVAVGGSKRLIPVSRLKEILGN